MEALIDQVEWWFILFVLLSSVLSVLQIASLLSFCGILVMFMEPDAVVPIATIFFLSMNVTKMALFRSEVNWRLTMLLVLTSIPGILLGAYLISYLPTDIARRVISALVIVFLVVEIFKLKTYEIKNTTVAIFEVGASYGFLSGFLGSGSIVRTPLLMKMNLTKGAFVGTAAAASLFSNVIKLGSYWSSGLMTSYVVVNGLLSVGVGIIGAQIGKRCLEYMSESNFNNVVRVALLVSAIIGLVS